MAQYHKGEREAQERAGERSIGERNGRMMTNTIIAGAIPFIEKQPFFIAGSQASDGAVFASILSGEKGYLKVPDPQTIEINTRLITSNRNDPFWRNQHLNAKIGMLFIELATRKRFRVNGSLTRQEELLRVQIDQAYPNCPKYIQQRDVVRSAESVYDDWLEQGVSFTSTVCDLIRKADTFFVASSDDAGNLDASHRGGPPGFVTIEQDGSLLIPDYIGNSLFNTLGNFLTNPKAGLVFPHFERHQSLQLTGSAEVVWNKNDPQDKSGGTGRFWKFYTEQWLLLQNLKGYNWEFINYSPFNPKPA